MSLLLTLGSFFCLEAGQVQGLQAYRVWLNRHIMIKLSNIKDKVSILKAAREKDYNLQGNSHKAISRILNRNDTVQKSRMIYSEH